MAKNDKVLLDGIIDDRVGLGLPSTRRDEAFEYLAFEQILKDADLSKDEIEEGTVDGRNDGGIDGFFILVNGHFLSDPENFVWPRTGSQIEVWIITCKHHDTFKQAPVDKLAASLAELLDFGLSTTELKGDYSDQVLRCRENLKFAYRKLSPRLSSFSINFCYASRGNASDIGESVASRSEQIKNIAEHFFGNCHSNFAFYGSTELVELHRKIPIFSLELPFCEALSRGERYVILATLKDYYNFISDPDSGKLRRYLFDSNIRDFMGLNRVNEDIKSTLDNEDSPDFWWLNNGVTILSTAASVVGKSIQLQDIQIVNGLQTTESIYRYFASGGQDKKDRSILIKIIVSSEEVIRDAITKATNNQTNVEPISLHATDKIQRDIEDILVRNQLFYERRKNYYVNLGHPASDIITPLYLAAGYINLILKSPFAAATLRSKFIRSSESYNLVFSPKTPVNVWPKIAISLKRTDEVLEKMRLTLPTVNERFVKNWRQITCFLAISKIFGKYNFSVLDMVQLDENRLTDKEIEDVWLFITQHTPRAPSGGSWKRKNFIINLCHDAANYYCITGIQDVETVYDFTHGNIHETKRIDMGFVLKVNELLPRQPWKRGIHKEIATILGCTPTDVSTAIVMLIEEGIINRQKNGVVYDLEGNVLCFDQERVDSLSMELAENETNSSPNTKNVSKE
jgi:hypothetical protein